MEDEIKTRIAESQGRIVEEIGLRIKELRLAKDMSQAVLAQKLGLSRAAVTQWETGQATCNYAQALELEKILGADVCFIIFGRSHENMEDRADPPSDGYQEMVATA